ncbi:MAG: hypothetical protein GF384_07380 [Elusimicrobia bacterium]|nr:hypothetical protein [Elusimicrobiota bacterium]MBD3412478.1 hypothetical protein [Elusimicrobiota bacterium]
MAEQNRDASTYQPQTKRIFAILSEQELMNSIQAVAIRSEALMSKDAPGIAVRLPVFALNNFYASISFDNVTYLDNQGNDISEQTNYAAGAYSENRFAREYYVKNTQDSSDTPYTSLARYAGGITVEYFNFKDFIVTPGKPSSGLVTAQFEDNHVSLILPKEEKERFRYDSVPYPLNNIIAAFDMDGNIIKETERGYVSFDDFSISLEYETSPAKILIALVSEKFIIDIPLDMGTAQGEENALQSKKKISNIVYDKPSAEPPSSAAVPENIEALYQKICTMYASKMPRDQAEAMVNTMKQNYKVLPSEQLIPILTNMINSLKAQGFTE